MGGVERFSCTGNSRSILFVYEMLLIPVLSCQVSHLGSVRCIYNISITCLHLSGLGRCERICRLSGWNGEWKFLNLPWTFHVDPNRRKFEAGTREPSPAQVLPQLAEDLALAWEPLLAAVCSRREDVSKASSSLSEIGLKFEDLKLCFHPVLGEVLRLAQACRHYSGDDPQVRSV